jgi:hypothetical protein
MSDKINDGGPAFPAQEQIDYPSISVTQHYPGMTLRDYFAARALPALIADGVLSNHVGKAAYGIADAMIAARTNGGGDE